MPIVSLLGIEVLNNPARFTDPFKFKITFKCLQPLKKDLEWKLIYVDSSRSLDHDQELDTILVGPVPVGINKVMFQVDPPLPESITASEFISMTVILLSCSYAGREFVRVGYNVNNQYNSEELRENPPAKVQVQHVVRSILAEKPRVTRFNIVWDNEDPDEYASDDQVDEEDKKHEKEEEDGEIDQEKEEKEEENERELNEDNGPASFPSFFTRYSPKSSSIYSPETPPLSTTTIFAFAKHPYFSMRLGFILLSENRYWAEDIPVSLVNALNSGAITQLRSISIMPDLSWIICMDDGQYLYTDDFLPRVLEHLLWTKGQDQTNPLCIIRAGPRDQYFIRRRTTIHWNLEPPLLSSCSQLMRFGIHSELQDITFGLNNNVIYIFTDGFFLWDIDPSHPINGPLQMGFLAGWQLESAAMSMNDPNEYFLFWGHGEAHFRVDYSIIPKVHDLMRMKVLNCQKKPFGYRAIEIVGQSVQRVFQQIKAGLIDRQGNMRTW